MKKTVILNGEVCVLGETKVVSKGINMRCEPCLFTGNTIIFEDGKYYLSMKDCDMFLREERFNDFFVDTKENRKKIRKECADWIREKDEAVERQFPSKK